MNERRTDPTLDHTSQGFDPIATAIERIREGGMVIVVDDAERENEGDIIFAAEKVTPEHINFLAREARGLVCVAAERDHLERLELHPMVPRNTARLGTAFTVSIDAAVGITTGISASDRAETIRQFVDPRTRPDDLARPGHVFPLRAVRGGVLTRAGHTEAAVDLSRLAGSSPQGVLCEIMDDDGSMARTTALRRMAEKFDLPMITIHDLIEYRRRHENLVVELERVPLPTRFGEFSLRLYGTRIDDDQHVALVIGDIHPDQPVLVRVHSECLTGDLFHSLRCDCGDQLEAALDQIARAGSGVFLYMRQEGRGIGLRNKMRAYKLQDQGADTVEANQRLGFPADLRHYGIGAQILVDIGVRKMRLLTNNPKKIIGLEAYGLELVERVGIEMNPNPRNMRYLQVKRDKMGHMLDTLGGQADQADADASGTNEEQ